MFDSPRENQFTQGTIFSCAYAESYENIATYGLVITARCDAAQNKAPIYNFVPVVRLTDWILRDGAEIILQREMQDLLNRKKSILRQANISESLLDSKTTDEILQLQLIPMAAVDKKIAVKAKEYKEFSNREVRIKKALDLWDNEILTEEIKLSRKTLDQVIQELASNRLVGHYLLREMPSLYNDKNGDYVALLREIHHIKKATAKKITIGLAKEPIPTQNTQEDSCPRFVGDDDYCMPVARLKSPWMEHLMQSLTMLFARIGIEDIDVTAVKKSLTNLGLDEK